MKGIKWVMPKSPGDLMACWNNMGRNVGQKKWWSTIRACIWWAIWKEKNLRACWNNMGRNVGQKKWWSTIRACIWWAIWKEKNLRYPADLYKRAKVDSVLDWHRSHFPRGKGSYVFYSVLAPVLGLPLNPQAVAEAEKVLLASLSNIESVWLLKNGRFLLGSGQPSIADLSLVCEMMTLEILDAKDRERILSPYKRVLKWIDDVKSAMAPHFNEFHSTLTKFKEELAKQRLAVRSSVTKLSREADLHSKM